MKTSDAELFRSIQQFAQAAGFALPEFDVTVEDGRVPSSAYRSLWESLATQAPDDPWFFARSGMKAELKGTLATVAYACGTKATVREALQTLTRAFALIDEAAIIEIAEGKNWAAVRRSYGSERGPLTWAGAQFSAGTLVALVDRMAGGRVRPQVVRLCQEGDEEAAARGTELFGGEVQLGAALDEIIYAAADLEVPMVRAEPELSAVLDGLLEAAIAALGKAHEGQALQLPERVKAEIARTLVDGPSLETIARSMGMSGRTLQRRLREHDVAFSTLLDQARSDLAIRHMQTPELNLSEIAFLVGFSEPAAFTHAFKKWTGRSPSSYRQELLQTQKGK